MGPHFLPLVCLMAATQQPSSKYGEVVVARSAGGQSHLEASREAQRLHITLAAAP